MRRPDPELGRLSKEPKEARGISRLAKMRSVGQRTRPDEIPADSARDLGPTPFVWTILGGTLKQEARAAAVMRLERLGIPLELQGAQDLTEECEWQILARAMRDPDDQAVPLAKDVDELRDFLNEDEKAYLITRYLDFEEECDPGFGDLTEAEYLAIEEAAKKKPSDSLGQLLNFGSRSLALFITTTAARRASSATGTSGGSTESAEKSGS